MTNPEDDPKRVAVPDSTDVGDGEDDIGYPDDDSEFGGVE